MTDGRTPDQWRALTEWARSSGALPDRELRFATAFLDLLERGEPIAMTHQEQADRLWEIYSTRSQDPQPDVIAAWLRRLPAPGWFALWDDLGGSGPEPGHAHCIEVRLTGSGIELRATGNQHTDSGQQLSDSQLAALEEIGWTGRVDYRRRLVYPDVDAGEVDQAAAAIEQTLDVYGFDRVIVEAGPGLENFLPPTFARRDGL